MPIATFVLTTLFSSLPLHADPQTAAPTPAPPATPTAAPAEEALGGLDPVRLLKGEEVDGRDAYTVTWRGLVYYFSTPETKAAFEQDPGRYAVSLDGLCARMGPPVMGSQSLHAVHDGRLYVFGSEECQKRFTDNATRSMPLLRPSPTPRPRRWSGDARCSIGR